MEQQDILNTKVGNKEIPKLEAKEIEVHGVKVEEKGEKNFEILILMCKHPDKDELIDMSKIKIIDGDKTKVLTSWVKKDEDGNIQKGSAIDKILKLAKVDMASELTGKVLPTTYQAEDGSYLCLKGY